MFRRIQPQNFCKVLTSIKLQQCQLKVQRNIHGVICQGRNSCFTVALLKRMHKKSQQLHHQERCFWGVDVAFNRVDEERVRLAGPDRAAAEWVLRNGGAIKWTTSSNHLNDYNMLPTTQFENYKLEEIDLTGTDVIGIGFEHLKDLHHVKKIKLHGVKTTGDDGLSYLSHVTDSLTDLEISSCPMITEKGLAHLVLLSKLKRLVLYDLIEIRNFDTAVANLSQKMPGVNILKAEPVPAEESEEKQ